MMMTGLKDMNGIDIKTGDVLKHSEAEWERPVAFKEGKFKVIEESIDMELYLTQGRASKTMIVR